MFFVDGIFDLKYDAKSAKDGHLIRQHLMVSQSSYLIHGRDHVNVLFFGTKREAEKFVRMYARAFGLSIETKIKSKCGDLLKLSGTRSRGIGTDGLLYHISLCYEVSIIEVKPPRSARGWRKMIKQAVKNFDEEYGV